MPYDINNITLESIDSLGNTMMTPITFTAATIPSMTEYMAIGNRIKMTVTVDASGGDDFVNKIMNINVGLFVANITSAVTNYVFGYSSNGFLTNSPVLCAINLPSLTIQQQFKESNLTATMEADVTFTTATFVLEFYVTVDSQSWMLNVSWKNNYDRFLLATYGFPQLSNNTGTNSYINNFYAIGLTGEVNDALTNYIPIGNTGNPVVIPVSNRFYNSDYLGLTTGMRYLREITITCPSQIALGASPITFATMASAQPLYFNIDFFWNITSQALSLNEDNFVEIQLRGLAKTGIVTNPAVTGIKAMLIRVDDISNLQDFASDLEMSDVQILQGVVVSGQLNNKIYSPCDWFEDVPNPDDITIQFVINGFMLSSNGVYRIIINVYDDVNQDYVTAHISPELIANFEEPIVPSITGFLSVYNKEFSGNELTVSPHQRVKASIEIDKTAYNAALALIGVPGTFDDALVSVTCEITQRAGALMPTQSYVPNTLTPPLNNQILSSNMVKKTDNATTLRLEALFRIEEEYANTSNIFTWIVTINQPSFSVGATNLNRVIFEQKLDVTDFENDVFAPKLLAVRFFDADLYPASKVPLLNICNQRYLVAEVEKDPLFIGTINLIATIYPASSSGATTSSAIDEEEDWVPFQIQMAQEFSGKLDSVETSFGSDDFASFVINVNQLTLGQEYWVTAIALQTDPDYCPIGLINDIKIDTINFVGGWNITVDLGFLITEILAHPDYVGGINKARFRVIDPPTNVLVGTSQTIVGSVLNVLNIRSSTPSVLLQVQVDANFDPGTGPHTVRHELNLVINLPAYGPVSTNLDTNSYICIDLG